MELYVSQTFDRKIGNYQRYVGLKTKRQKFFIFQLWTTSCGISFLQQAFMMLF